MRRWISQLIISTVILLIVGAPAIATRAQIPIRLWHSWTGAAEVLLNTWIEDYQRRTPNIVIQSEYIDQFALLDRFISTPNEDRPDLLLAPSDWGGDLYANALTAALDTRLTAEQRAQVSSVAWDTLAYNGKTIGVPVAVEGLVLYYNRVLVATDEIAATWADLLDQAGNATGSLGLLIGAGFYPTAGIYLALGGGLVDQHGGILLDATALTDYLSYVRTLYDRSGGTIQIGGTGNEFRSGNSIYTIDGTWQYTYYRGALGDNLGIAPLPAIGEKVWRPLIRSMALYVSASSRQLDAALSFARFATNSQAQSQMASIASFIPVNLRATINDDNLTISTQQLLANGVAIPTRHEILDYWRILQTAIDAVAIRGISAEQAAKEVLEHFNPSAVTPAP